ncbi:MAG: hypothetical protein KJZ59_06540 [Pararhodobacter sp.]|nr:hypothetical protein [Pararhodobacter sp.]
MKTDPLGPPLSGTSPALIAALDEFIGGVVAYETRAVAILGLAAPWLARALAASGTTLGRRPSTRGVGRRRNLVPGWQTR